MTELALLTTSQVAKMLAVDPASVRRWATEGKLVPAVLTPGGHYRFRRADVERILSPADARTERSAS